jgi:predicted nuclease of predicted toxin-antitoxin system
VRFLVDMPLSPALAEALRQAGHDAVHASELGLATAPDASILETARSQGRIAVTADLDYPRLLALEHADGPALILFRGGSYSEEQVWRLLRRALERAKPSDLEASITVIERSRIRRRKLPVSG